MKKKTKNILIASISLSAISFSTILPIALTSYQKYNPQSNDDNKSYNFDGKTFNNRQELKNYALSNVIEQNTTETNRESWTIKFDNQLMKFNSFQDLISFVNQQVEKYEVESSFKFDTNSNLALTPFELDKLYLKSNNNEQVTIYKGINDQYYFTEQEAKDSYLQIHEAYYFDGIYFSNKQELANFLNKNFDKYMNNLTTNSKNIVLVSPSGVASRPLNPEKIKSKDENEVKVLEDFVNKYAKKYIKKIDDNDTAHYYDADLVKQNPGQYVNEFDDYSYMTINSNQGKSNYIIDVENVEENEDYTLFGPYYLQAGGEIEKITDPNSWKKLEGTDFSFISNAVYADLLSQFINLVTNDKFEEDQKYPFNIQQLENETSKYFEYLKKQSPETFDSLMETIRVITKGTKYSLFYKIPILYIKTVEELMFHRINYQVIQATKDYYSLVCDYIDQCLYLFIPKSYLISINGDHELFSFSKLFKINENNLDLNYDVETLVDIIQQNFPKLIPAINIISRFQSYGLQMPNFLPFDYEYLYEQLKDVVDIKSMFNESYDIYWLEQIYNIFVSVDKDLLIQSFKNLLSINNTKLNNNQIENIYTQIISPRVQVANNAVAKLHSDLEIYSTNSGVLDMSESFLGKLTLSYREKLVALYKINKSLINIDLMNTLRLSTISEINIPFELLDFQSWMLDFQYMLLGNMAFTSNNIFAFAACFYGMSLIKLLTLALDIASLPLTGLAVSSGFRECISNITSICGNLSKILELFKVTCKILKCVPFVSIAVSIVEFLLNLVKTEKFSYIFETEDAKFIWNGGEETTFFFGLIPGPVKGPEDMKMLPPQRITRPHIQNQYYYRNKIYDDVVKLKKDQLVDIANGDFSSSKTSLVYKFDNPNSNDPTFTDSFDEIGNINEPNTLVYDIYQDIVKNGNKYYVESTYELADGNIVFDRNLAKDRQIKDFVDNKIKPIKISLMPNLLNGYPTTNELGQEINPFELPEKSWTSFGGYKFNENNDIYIIVDPNDNSNTLLKPEDILTENFRNSFNVESKTVFKNSTLLNEKYSKFDSCITDYYVYKVTNDLGNTKYFLNESAALNWLLNEYEFSVNDFVLNKTIYIYKDKKFDSIDEYLNWIYETAIEG